MPGETPDTITSEEGEKIPVRMESGYPTYTDNEGKQLATGHDISPGSETKWGLEPTVEHRAPVAHEMGAAEAPLMNQALSEEKTGHLANERGDPDLAAQHFERAGQLKAQADNAAEEARLAYDAEQSQFAPEPDTEQTAHADPESLENLAGKENTAMSFEEEALRREFARRWSEKLSAHPPSDAYKAAKGFPQDIATIDGFTEVAFEGYALAGQFDAIRFDPAKTEEALRLIDEMKKRLQMMADIESGAASDPNYGKPPESPQTL